MANMTLTVPLRWRENTPWVQCHEHWLRAGDPDWHAYKDGGLCYIHDNEWTDAVGAMESECGADEMLQGCAALCAQLSVQLMERHLLAWRQKLKRWPKSWSAWGHGTIGTKEYEKVRAQRTAEFVAAYSKMPQAMAK